MTRAAGTGVAALALTLCAGALGATSVGVSTPPAHHGSSARWGFAAHEMATRVALRTLPDEVPAFFREAEDELAFLAPEPDRWNGGGAVEMERAWAYDHYVDMENLPDGALDAPDRFAYHERLVAAGLDDPARDGGFLPYRIVEVHQRLVGEWRRWRTEADPARRAFLERRIVADAGILAHYVTDGSQPHHTTIHFNGWAAGAPNPEGYTTERDFHSRFERHFVDAHVTEADVARRVPERPRSVVGRARAEVLAYLHESHAAVPTLYRLERDIGFRPEGSTRAETRDFAAARLAAGTSMLATLWWSAWLEAARG